MIKYSSMEAYAILYSGYNDVDIYVEDSSLIGMYERMFKKIFADRYRVESIIPLGPKKVVLKEAVRLKNDKNRKRLFVVDGDFDWCNKSTRSIHNLYELKLYSIENFSFDDEAMVILAGKLKPQFSMEQVVDILDIPEINRDLDSILPLMKVFAVARKLKSKLHTVSYSLNRLVDQSGRNVDRDKVFRKAHSFYRELCREFGWKVVRSERRLFNEKSKKISELPRRLIAGKYHGINLLMKHFQDKFQYRGSREHFVCELIESSSFSLDPGFMQKIKRI